MGEKVEDNRGSALKNLSGTSKSQSKIKLLETGNGTNYDKQLIANDSNRFLPTFSRNLKTGKTKTVLLAMISNLVILYHLD